MPLCAFADCPNGGAQAPSEQDVDCRCCRARMGITAEHRTALRAEGAAQALDGAALVYEDLANNAARKPDREMAARVVKVLRARAVQHRSFASTCWQAVAKEQAPAPVRRCSYGRCEAVLQPEELGPQCDACNEHGL